MLTDINPKLTMRNKALTKEFYVDKLGFQQFGNDYDGYLMVQKDNIQIHFFEFKELDPKENYGQVYIRTDHIDSLYQSMLDKKISIHPAGHLQTKPRGQKEFAMLRRATNESALCLSYPGAVKWAEQKQLRLPSAAEYDLIAAAVERGTYMRMLQSW